MILLLKPGMWVNGSFPRVSGGDPNVNGALLSPKKFSPRERG